MGRGAPWNTLTNSFLARPLYGVRGVIERQVSDARLFVRQPFERLAELLNREFTSVPWINRGPNRLDRLDGRPGQGEPDLGRSRGNSR